MRAKLRALFVSVILMSTAACVDNSRGGGDPVPAPVETLPPPVTEVPPPETPPEQPPAQRPEATLESALLQSADTVIVPTVERFADRARQLVNAGSDFCAGPDEASLSDLQDVWRGVFAEWYRVSLYNFGPLNDDLVFPPFTFIDSLRLRGTDYLESVRGEIASDIADDRVLDDEYFGRKTFQFVGLLALESAIFETSTSDLSAAPADIVAEYEFQPRKCEVLQGLAGQLNTRAQTIRDKWVVEFPQTGGPYRSIYLSGELEDGTASFAQLFISGQEFLDYLQARRVVLTAARVSDFAWDAIAAAIDEVELLLRGTATATDSIFAVMEDTGNQNEVDAVEESLRQVRQAIADRDADMLEITLGFLDGNYKREIPDALGIQLGINFSDGD